MILVDTGPLVALFDPSETYHSLCVRLLERIDESLVTTTPVLTQAFHLLRPGSPGPPGLMAFITDGGLSVLPLDDQWRRRCFELMVHYADQPMDFADASIVSAAERCRTDRVFTLDLTHFGAYRIRRGYHQIPFKVIGDPEWPRIVREGTSEDCPVTDEHAHIPGAQGSAVE